MFLIMGLPWMFESFHHLLHGNHSGESSSCSNDFGEIIFRISSAFNILRGVFLFIIFPCKPAVLQQLKTRVGLQSQAAGRQGTASIRTSSLGSRGASSRLDSRSGLELAAVSGPARQDSLRRDVLQRGSL
jgi:hypothetical protein